MPISQILLTSSSGGSPSPAINIYGWVSSMNEGSTNTVTVGYEDYPPTTIYWQIVNDGTSNDDFIAGEPGGAQLGNFQISGTGSTNFSWTTTEDLTTEGNENYLLQVGTFLGGTNLLNETLTITDTSLTPTSYTATHSASNQGSSGVHIDSNPTNDAWATTVPIGATIISSVTGSFTVNAVAQRDANNNWFFSIGAGPIGGFTAGETHTFSW
jgi:hypothetical protein